jgi:hypothetical protein
MSLLAKAIERYVSIEVRTLMKRAENEIRDLGYSPTLTVVATSCNQKDFSRIDSFYMWRKGSELNEVIVEYKQTKAKALIMQKLLGVDEPPSHNTKTYFGKFRDLFPPIKQQYPFEDFVKLTEDELTNLTKNSPLAVKFTEDETVLIGVQGK